MRIRFILFSIALYLLSCSNVDYKPIPGVDKEINELGKMIAEYQRDEVWTGGNEYSGCYTWDHRKSFLNKGELENISQKAKKNKKFKAGVIALKQLPINKQNDILEIWNRPIDPTWRQTGKIGEGTTEAGQQTEIDIAETLTGLIKNMLKLSDKEIEDL